jgi:hypothetical protein
MLFVVLYIFNSIKSNGLYLSTSDFSFLLMLQGLAWFGIQFISTLKIGGNEGNLQAGLLLFLPFMTKHILSNRWISIKVPALLLFTLLIAGAATLKGLKTNWNLYQKKITTNKFITSGLTEIGIKRNSNLLIGDDLYVVLKRQGFTRLSSVNGIFHFFAVPEKNGLNFSAYLKNKIINKDGKY